MKVMMPLEVIISLGKEISAAKELLATLHENETDELTKYLAYKELQLTRAWTERKRLLATSNMDKEWD